MSLEKPDRFKVLVIGEPGVGKTSFVNRYVHDAFSLERRPTNGVDFAEYVFQWSSDLSVKLQFWDVAGQERLGTQSSVYFRGAHAAIVVYDVTNRESIDAVSMWKQLLDERVGSEIPSLLLANKIDLICDNSDDFDATELGNLVGTCNFTAGYPISNLQSFNVAQSVKKLVELLIDRRAKEEKDSYEPVRIIDLSQTDTVQTSRCGGWCGSGASKETKISN